MHEHLAAFARRLVAGGITNDQLDTIPNSKEAVLHDVASVLAIN